MARRLYTNRILFPKKILLFKKFYSFLDWKIFWFQPRVPQPISQSGDYKYHRRVFVISLFLFLSLRCYKYLLELLVLSVFFWVIHRWSLSWSAWNESGINWYWKSLSMGAGLHLFLQVVCPPNWEVGFLIFSFSLLVCEWKWGRLCHMSRAYFLHFISHIGCKSVTDCIFLC